MTTMKINGQSAEFAQIGDLLVSTTPVTRGQYHGDTEVDRAGEWVTGLTRHEVLAWCQEHGVRLLTDDEWDAAGDAGIIGYRVVVGDVWEEIDGDQRVLRRGSWVSSRGNFRVIYRGRDDPVNRRDFIGFRVCLSSPIDEHEH